MKGKKTQKRPHKHKRKLDVEEQQYKREQRLSRKLKQEEHALDFAARQDRKLAAMQTVDVETVALALKQKEISAYDRLLGVLGVDERQSATAEPDEPQDEDEQLLSGDEENSETSDAEESDCESEAASDDSDSSGESSCEEEREADGTDKLGLASFDSAGDAVEGSGNFRSSGFSRVLVKGASMEKVQTVLRGENFRSHKQLDEAALHRLFAGPEGTRRREVASVISDYMDAVLPTAAWEVTAAHVASHVLRTRDLVIGNSALEEIPVGDSGFARPRVLVLSATRSLADRWIRKFLEFLDERRRANIRGLEKYEKKFLAGEKPLDGGISGRATMFAGHTDDNFRLGVSVSKRSVKLLSNFETSDVIVASALGLATGGEEISDYLSSLEVVVLDQSDLFRFQNWEHVVRVLDAANRRPKNLNFDISRIRASFIADRQRLFRQTLLVSDRPVTEMLAVLEDRWKFPAIAGNFRGRVLFMDEISDSLVQRLRKELGVHRQIFLSPQMSVDGSRKSGEISDPRIDLLREKFWKEVGRELTRLVVCVSDYFSFLRVRKFFKEETEARVAEISEFSSDRKLQAARENFETGEKPVLLITERLLWFKPLKLKNVQHVLFFGVPESPANYEHLVRRCAEPRRANVVTISTPEELNQLERIVGTSEVAKVLPRIDEQKRCFQAKMAFFS